MFLNSGFVNFLFFTHGIPQLFGVDSVKINHHPWNSMVFWSGLRENKLLSLHAFETMESMVSKLWNSTVNHGIRFPEVWLKKTTMRE
jgi:hypothetical protein